MENKIFINACYHAFDTLRVEKFFDAKALRRLDNFTKLALKGAKGCLLNAGVNPAEEEDFAIIISTGFGPVQRTVDFMNSIIDDGDLCASPLAFSSSVHNAALTHITMLLNIKGPCLTVSNLETSFHSALETAKTWLNTGLAKKVLVGAVDEVHSVAQQILKDKAQVFADYKDTSMQQGAAFFLLSHENLGNELPEKIENISTPLNPSRTAFELAKKYDLFLSKMEVTKMVSDFIKTELARGGHDIMSVFETDDIAPVFYQLGLEAKTKMIMGALMLFSNEPGTDFNIDSPIVDNCYDEYKKHKLVNFFTSGSTGYHKNCTHSQGAIREEAEGVRFLFKDIKRVFCTVPMHHSYGFAFGLAMAKLLEVPVFSKPPLPFKWEETLQEGDLLIAFPLFLKQLLGADFIFPKGVTVLTATAPCPDEVIVELKKRGMSDFVEIYGASEGGAFAYRKEAYDPFTILPFWRPVYNDDDMLEKLARKTTSLEVDVPDIVQVFEDGRFKPVGRKDNAVQVAGINVYPRKVEEIIKKFKFVADAAVRLMRPDEGERLKAFIVLKPGCDIGRVLPDLRAHMQENLTVHEMPRQLSFGDAIPVTDYGKRKDW
ncbi:4-coumarate--CoA ligase (photoactive yellow protein activation family) [Elusimicrobium posterum]|uniref:beta-ketoacyl synthase chain length factor n=1 Tax=Elusimicrobium posterum TaxID=3116653 RepID=UPI003C712031